MKKLSLVLLLILAYVASINKLIAQNNYKLVWSDEFNQGTKPDSTKWVYETGKHGWGNHELENYTAGDNCYISEGTLKIVARHDGAGQQAGDYSSTRMTGIQKFTYGKFEIRAKIPENKGNGLWPAIWMLGDTRKYGWPGSGELDIMENVSYAPDTVYFTIHCKAHNHRNGTQISSGGIMVADLDKEFHTYGLIWTPDQLKFYLDNEENVTLVYNKPKDANQDNWPFDKPFYMILNLAVGGDWGGKLGVNDNNFPAIFEIDYVRIYQQ